MLKERRENAPLINQQIRAESLQLITQDGDNIGIISRQQALQQAEAAGLDLVLIAPMGKEGVPVVKIMDFGKVLYEKKKKSVEAKKHQKVIQIKEIKINPKIGEHDYQTKIKQAIQFLRDGKRIKITLSFKGREIATKETRGSELFAKIEKSFEECDLTNSLAQEQDAKMGKFWSRIYYLK
jgi:translation initiation factor IF-3